MNSLAAITLWLATLTTGQRPYNHIFFVLLENVGYESVVGDTVNAPYINNELFSQAVLYSKSFGITNPILPNFLAIFSCDTQGLFIDRFVIVLFTVSNLWVSR